VTDAVGAAADKRSAETRRSSSIRFMLCAIAVIGPDDEEKLTISTIYRPARMAQWPKVRALWLSTH
ncbi:hypothetical protein GW17_00040468, partial [Ensete ventricosum]